MKKQNNSNNSLRKNSVSLIGALAMSAAFMGPAVSIFFNMGPASSAAGYAFPLSFLVSMLAVLFIANTIIQFSKKVNGANFAYSYTSHGIGPKTGFMAGWILLFAYTMITPITFAGFGAMTSEFLERQFDIHISWVLFFLIVALVVSGLSYLGISHSAKTTIIFLFLELIVILILCITVISNGELNSVQPFLLSSSPHGLSSIGLGMVFGILSFTGFESAANLGEETKEAKKTIPKAITTSVIMIGVLYVLSAYVAAIGFNNLNDLQNNGSPFDSLARTFWGSNFAWIIGISALNGVFANAIAGQASIVRNLFSLGREGILPHTLSKTNSNGVPVHAILFNLTLSIIIGLAIGLWKDGWAVWNILGGIMSISLIVVYGIVTVALPFFYKRNYPQEFSTSKHLIFPIIGILLLILPLYSSLYPIPKFPYNLAPYLLIIWSSIGFIYYKRLSSRQANIAENFGAVLEE
ncbi:APC family permease [Niallia circulans]|uniref:APC family permease n=1 Tax=Niallia circulans TaxID=1397 RepID=UPI0026E945D2|nr:APC family permease [Niallia circulans]